MLRHSKSQRHLDGSPLLSLPPKTCRYVPTPLLPSSLSLYRHVEALAAKLAPPDPTGRYAISLLRLLRQICISPYLVGGGVGCSDQLEPLEEASRACLQASHADGGGGEGGWEGGGGGGGGVVLAVMTPAQAIAALASLDRKTEERRFHGRFHNAQHRGEFVMHSNTSQRIHTNKRAFAVDAIATKLEEAQATALSLSSLSPPHQYPPTPALALSPLSLPEPPLLSPPLQRLSPFPPCLLILRHPRYHPLPSLPCPLSPSPSISLLPSPTSPLPSPPLSYPPAPPHPSPSETGQV